jgi:predicted permease
VRAQLESSLRAAGRDLVFAGRQFRRSRALVAGVVLSLGFGIGASATVYSWMQGMVVRPLPAVRDADQLITVRPELKNGFGISLDEYREWRDEARTVSGLAAAALSLFAVETSDSRGGTSDPIYGMFVSPNYFDLLGVLPAQGRAIGPPDDLEGAPAVAVISDAFWRRAFDAAPDIVGRAIRVNSQTVRVVGVAPAAFGGNLAIARFDLWLPLSLRPLLIPSDGPTWKRRDSRWLDAIGRLRPGTTLSQANDEFAAIGRRQAERFPENIGRGARAIPLDVGTAQQLEPVFAGLVAVTLLVVLLICSNVANLLLTRAAARDREFAVRLSLGAGTARLVRQLMTESSVLAMLGAAVGIGLATMGDGLLALLMPTTSIVFGVDSSLDLRFLGFVVATTGACVLVFGLAPALMASRVAVVETLRSGSGGSSARGGRMRSTLVVAQFAFALSILVCAALFLRRDRIVNAMDLGYRGGEEVLLMQTEMSLAGYAEPARWGQTIELAADRVSSLPGVRGVALASFVPLGLIGYARRVVEVPSFPVEPGTADRVLVNGVSPDYFDLMGIAVLQGRAFTVHDTPDQPRVVIINQAFADKYFVNESPLGKSFSVGGREALIVGVARNGRYDYRDIDNDRMPLIYYAWHQSPSPFVAIHVRTAGDPLELADAVRSVIRSVDPDLPLLDPVTLREYADVPFSISRSAVKVLAVLGTVALLLASIGLFSVVSYGVTLRTREMGIRLAVGATAPVIVVLILRSAARLIIIGTSTGIVVALGLATILRQKIPQLPGAALREYVAPALVLAAGAIVAGLIPALRAASVDPARTLRTD